METLFTENLQNGANSSDAQRYKPLKESEEVEIEDFIRKGQMEEVEEIKEDPQEGREYEENVMYNRQWGCLIA